MHAPAALPRWVESLPKNRPIAVYCICGFQVSGTAVAELRKREGVNEHEFADMLGITVRLLRRWEAGVSVPFGAALKALNLVRVYGIQHLA